MCIFKFVNTFDILAETTITPFLLSCIPGLGLWSPLKQSVMEMICILLYTQQGFIWKLPPTPSNSLTASLYGLFVVMDK